MSGPLDLVPAPLRSSLAGLASVGWSGVSAAARMAVRWLSGHAAHPGLPALIVAALFVCVGYRVLKRSARFILELAAVTLALVLASELGWIRW